MNTIGIICRWLLAGVAVVWFAQFLLLLEVDTPHAQELAGECIGRALLCGAVAGFWFYKAKKKEQPKAKVKGR